MSSRNLIVKGNGPTPDTEFITSLKSSFFMAFLCDICDREFTENRNLTRNMKTQHGNLWSCHCCNQSFNRRDNYEMHQRVCLFKTTGKRSGGHRVGDVLTGTVNEYRLKRATSYIPLPTYTEQESSNQY